MKFDLDEQQRDFAASIDAALGAADLPAAIRAWAAGDTAPGRKVWAQLADLGVTALIVPEKFDGIDAHPVDLAVAAERLGRWCVPGPVTESIAVAPILLADDDRSAALASGELIATVALPPQVPRAVDADTAGLILVAANNGVSDGTAGEQVESVDPSRKLFAVSASGDGKAADVARAYEFGVLATAAQLVGAGQALLDMSVEYAKQRSQFGKVIGTYQAIKHKLADVHIALELARPLVYGAALSVADRVARDRTRCQCRQGGRLRCRATGGALGAADTRCHRVHARARHVAVVIAGAGLALGVGRSCTASATPIGGIVSEERELLRDTVAALVDKHASPAAVRSAIESERGYDESLWKLLCEQVGAAALVVPEELGGAGGELADAAVVLEELGRALVPTPLLGTTLAELALLAADQQDTEALEELAAGTKIGAVAFDADLVINGDVADIVIAADGEQLRRLTKFTAHRVDAMDVTRRLARVEPQEASGIGADPGLADTAAILLAAEQIGAAARCLDLTVAYTKDRVQFGRPIGSFQALKHRMADLYVAVQSARAVVNEAIAEPSSTSAALARFSASEAFSKVAGEAVQMHGGIAITWEHDIQLYFKRAHGSAQLLGPPREHLRRLESEVF